MIAPKPAFSTKPLSTAPRFIVENDAERLREEIRQCVAARAYQLYEQSGRQDGNDESNWARAESDVLRRDFEVHETGTWIRVDATVPELSANDLRIYVNRNQVVIKAERSGSDGVDSQDFREPNKLFWVADLPVEIDSSTATASVKAGRLSFMARKREHSLASIVASHLDDEIFDSRKIPHSLARNKERKRSAYTVPCMGIVL